MTERTFRHQFRIVTGIAISCMVLLIVMNVTACNKNEELPLSPPDLTERTELTLPVDNERERLVKLYENPSVFCATIEVIGTESPYGIEYYNIDLAQGIAADDCLYTFRIEQENVDNSFYITMECSPAEVGSEHDLTISVYREEEMKLVQQIETTTIETYFHDVKVKDVDFDGNLDFYWPTQKGAANWLYTFWIWDETAQCFISDPYGLDLLTTPSFDSENKIVDSHFTVNWQAATTGYWTYENSPDGMLLLPIRAIYAYLPDQETGIQQLCVEDFINGNWVEVYRQDIFVEGETIEQAYQELLRWNELTYHGDES